MKKPRENEQTINDIHALILKYSGIALLAFTVIGSSLFTSVYCGITRKFREAAAIFERANASKPNIPTNSYIPKPTPIPR